MPSKKKLYAERDICEQKYYADHVSAMTRESLHGKSNIAAELAHRDEIIDELNDKIKAMENGDVTVITGVELGWDCVVAVIWDTEANEELGLPDTYIEHSMTIKDTYCNG